MPKTIRNKYYKYLTYEKLMEAHIKSRKGKGLRKEIILFNLKQEEYILWLLKELKNKTYKHGGYTSFYVTEPKVRKIEKSRYLDRIVHRWLVDNFLAPAFVPQFIPNSYACLKQKGMHRAAIYVQDSMKHCKRIWNEYYILKMDIAKYFDNINKEILFNIIKRKVKDENILWLINEILYAQKREKGLEIGYRNFFIMESCKRKYLQFKAFRTILLSIIFYFLLQFSFKESFNQFNKSFFSFDEYRTVFESSSECFSIAFLLVSGFALA